MMVPTAAPQKKIMIQPPTKKRVGGPGGAASPEVPIFLQKAYHMIDTCEPTICSWSEDGLTFIVKNTSLFETTIIPQFFKHNKFSSFVRQLNFYGFRKVKFSTSLRIDHKLEAETAKFWRFRHDKFRKGRKDLLVEIKRTPSSSSSGGGGVSGPSASGNNMAAISTNAKLLLHNNHRSLLPHAPLSSSTVMTSQSLKQNNKPEPEVTHLKTEMQVLKQRLESMTKNIDELTDMVKKVSVKDEEEEGGGGQLSPVVSPGVTKVEIEAIPGNKRKKMEQGPAAVKREIVGDYDDNDTVMRDLPIMPDWNPSSSDLTGVDSLLLGNSCEDVILPDLALSGGGDVLSNAPSPVPSDDAFVDDLFQAFADEDAIVPGLEALNDGGGTTTGSMNMAEAQNAPGTTNSGDNNLNQPDPQLMKRIEDSLSTIPRDMHEMVANRLIDAISNTQPMVESYSSVEESIKTAANANNNGSRRSISVECEPKVPLPLQAISEEDVNDNQPLATSKASTVTSTPSSIPLPLAVATLKTILSEYGVKISVDAQQQQQQVAARRSRSNSPSCSKDARRTNRSQGFSKLLPVVPMHA